LFLYGIKAKVCLLHSVLFNKAKIMKMKLFIAVLLMLSSTIGIKAQPPENQGPPKPPPAEKRWEHDLPIIKKHVTGITAKQETELKTAFFGFYKEADAMREKSKGQRPPKEEMDKVKNKRDEQLKKTLSAAQMEQFKKADPELRPKPPGQAPPPPASK
jgi:hypothetical protein